MELNILICPELMMMIFIALSIMNALKKSFCTPGYLIRTMCSAIPIADLCSRLITAKVNKT
jgi:hypothetical protein